MRISFEFQNLYIITALNIGIKVGRKRWIKHLNRHPSNCKLIDLVYPIDSRDKVGLISIHVKPLYTHNTPKHLTHTNIRKGLKTMINEHPRHFGNLVAGRYPEATGDVLLQCCCFGKIIYESAEQKKR
jgi:hypothetical protein